MNKCPNCGTTSRIREKDKYCHKCGCNLKTGDLLENKETISVYESVDDTIIKLCNYINELTKSQMPETPMEMAENTKALASLVEARAQLLNYQNYLCYF